MLEMIRQITQIDPIWTPDDLNQAFIEGLFDKIRITFGNITNKILKGY